MYKRSFDLVATLLTSPLWILALLIIAITVRIKIGSPIFFCQLRAGLREKPFTLIKFRTMRDTRDDAGNLLPDALRLTAFGNWLRSTSLDELPEVLNVLAGSMSLVGPRPLLLRYLDRYTPTQARRHLVRPGITGLTQVNGRNSLSWEEKFALDVSYVDNQSMLLDFRILLLTIKAVLFRHGITAAGDATMPEFNPQQQGDKRAKQSFD